MSSGVTGYGMRVSFLYLCYGFSFVFAHLCLFHLFCVSSVQPFCDWPAGGCTANRSIVCRTINVCWWALGASDGAARAPGPRASLAPRAICRRSLGAYDGARGASLAPLASGRGGGSAVSIDGLRSHAGVGARGASLARRTSRLREGGRLDSSEDLRS